MDTTTNNTNTATVTTIKAMPKGTKVKFSREFGGGEDELSHNTPSVCRLSKGRISNILGTVWWVKLKLAGLFVGAI